MSKLATLVVCPGRGTYNAGELGYLGRWHGARAARIAGFDAQRALRGETALSALDGADQFDPALHLRGDVATPLIYASGYADFLSIDRERHEIVAVTGNSMGWYTALACAGAVDGATGFGIANAMGTNSQAGEPGGQLLLTLVDGDWCEIAGLRDATLNLIARIAARPGHRLFESIRLGGMLVIAGNEAGLAAFLAAAPGYPSRAPMSLVGHGPFHTPLMHESSARAFAEIGGEGFDGPTVPLIDGRGAVWWPGSSDSSALRQYSFDAQILGAYDFTLSLRVALQEFAPDRIILVGPGETLGGAIAQALIALKWRGIATKRDFAEVQASAPFLVSMGRASQRALAVADSSHL